MAFNPILNNPYDDPKFHYQTDVDGNLDHEDIQKARRPFVAVAPPQPNKQPVDQALFSINEVAPAYGTHLINLLRKEVGEWRRSGYNGTTRITKSLLSYWFLDTLRDNKLFFVQREALETAIWLNEVAPNCNPGTNILNKLRQANQTQDTNVALNRVAFKMATGTGKTVVMAGLILYHFFNREEYRNDVRFADNFLLIAPGITIRDRLSVLIPEPTNRGLLARDYYRQRALVPSGWDEQLNKLNAKLVITNYHAFEPRTLQGNKRSPFDGKAGAEPAKEDFNQVLKRILPAFRTHSRLLILNDEAHHCYLPL